MYSEQLKPRSAARTGSGVLFHFAGIIPKGIGLSSRVLPEGMVTQPPFGDMTMFTHTPSFSTKAADMTAAFGNGITPGSTHAGDFLDIFSSGYLGCDTWRS